MSSTFDGAPLSPAESLRRSFAAAWGEIGAAWGVAPSTATVQGYLLVSDGPRSEPEVRRALGMSHRAASLALSQCEEWGLIERAETARRSGQRGPAATAWAVVDDHWEWFRRVARARKERETDPVLPVIEAPNEIEERREPIPELGELRILGAGRGGTSLGDAALDHGQHRVGLTLLACPRHSTEPLPVCLLYTSPSPRDS